MKYAFSAAVVPWGGQGSFFYCNLPVDIADEISEVTEGLRRGFGSVRVDVRCGESTWRTSLFLDSKAKSYLLPVKKAIRIAEEIEDGAIAQFDIELVDF